MSKKITPHELVNKIVYALLNKGFRVCRERYGEYRCRKVYFDFFSDDLWDVAFVTFDSLTLDELHLSGGAEGMCLEVQYPLNYRSANYFDVDERSEFLDKIVIRQIIDTIELGLNNSIRYVLSEMHPNPAHENELKCAELRADIDNVIKRFTSFFAKKDVESWD